MLVFYRYGPPELCFPLPDNKKKKKIYGKNVPGASQVKHSRQWKRTNKSKPTETGFYSPILCIKFPSLLIMEKFISLNAR